MKPIFISILIVCMSSTVVLGEDEHGLDGVVKLQKLLKEYKANLGSALYFTKNGTEIERVKSLEEVKNTLTGITTLIKTDQTLMAIEGIKDISAKLQSVTNTLNVANGALPTKELTNVFALLGNLGGVKDNLPLRFFKKATDFSQ